LKIFLHAAPGGVGLGATLHCAGVDPHLLNALEVQRDAAIGAEGTAARVTAWESGRNKSVAPLAISDLWNFSTSI